MASAAARELEGKVARTIHDAGAMIVERSTCGSGHNKIVFSRGGERRSFHFAKTPSDGRGSKNAITDLRKVLRELPERSEEPSPPPTAPAPPTVVQFRPEAAPSSKKLTPERRKAIARHYLTCSSLEELCEKEGIEQVQAEPLILGLKGDAANKLRKEINERKRAAARKLRPAPKPKRKPCTLLSPEKTAERNRRIYLYVTYGTTKAEAAELFNLTEERVRQIVRAEEKKDVG